MLSDRAQIRRRADSEQSFRYERLARDRLSSAYGNTATPECRRCHAAIDDPDASQHAMPGLHGRHPTRHWSTCYRCLCCKRLPPLQCLWRNSILAWDRASAACPERLSCSKASWCDRFPCKVGKQTLRKLRRRGAQASLCGPGAGLSESHLIDLAAFTLSREVERELEPVPVVAICAIKQFQRHRKLHAQQARSPRVGNRLEAVSLSRAPASTVQRAHAVAGTGCGRQCDQC